MHYPTNPQIDSLALTEDDAAKLLRTDPLSLLKKTPMGEQVAGAMNKEGHEPLKREEVEHRIREFLLQVGQYVWTCLLQTSTPSEKEQQEASAMIATLQATLKGEILGTIELYGPALSTEANRIHTFYEVVTHNPDHQSNPLTYANFRHLQAELQQSKRKQNSMRGELDTLATSKLAGSIPGVRALTRALIGKGGEWKKEQEQILRHLSANWKSKDVRMAYQRMKHMEYIGDIAKGRSILEGPSTVALLNSIHAALYGNQAYKVAGPALVGAPGGGKTSLLQDYFRSFGIEPLSADIDPGQSAFTLMAAPKLGQEEEVENKKRLLDMIHTLTKEDLKSLLESNPSFFASMCEMEEENLLNIQSDQVEIIREALKKPLRAAFNEELTKVFEGHVKKGYSYGLILKGLESNRPVILNEFPELQEWTFIHGLLTAIPASDSEASARPSSKPKEGEVTPNPKGWFFNTITGEWMRVKEMFRICFSGNIGVEYGNAGAPLALLSRLGSGLIHVGGQVVPQRAGIGLKKTQAELKRQTIDQEWAETVVWPHLSSRETGEFLLDDTTAYRLHFLITEVFPKMRAHLEKQHSGKHFTLSHRVLIDMCKAMNPEINRTPCDLDEAIMRALIRPTHGLRYDSLDYMVSMLLGTGYLKNHSEELDQLIPNLGAASFKQMIADVKDPFKKDDYTKKDDRYEGRCIVCGVIRCPCHGQEAKNYMDYLERTAVLAKVGLDPNLVQQLIAWQGTLLEKEQWPAFLETYFGTTGEDAQAAISPSDRNKIGEYVTSLIKERATDLNSIDVITWSVKKMLVKKTDLSDEWKKEMTDHWNALLQNADTTTSEGKETCKDALKFLVSYHQQKVFWDEAIDEKSIAKIKEFLNGNNDVEAVWLVSQLRSKGTGLDDIVQEKKRTMGVQIGKSELMESKKLIIGTELKSGGAGRGTKRAIPTSILTTPEFEKNYPTLLLGLQKLLCLVELDLATQDDVKDLLAYTEHMLNKTTIQGKVPQAKIPYVRVIRLLSRLKKETFDLEKAMKIFLEADIALPIMRDY